MNKTSLHGWYQTNWIPSGWNRRKQIYYLGFSMQPKEDCQKKAEYKIKRSNSEQNPWSGSTHTRLIHGR